MIKKIKDFMDLHFNIIFSHFIAFLAGVVVCGLFQFIG